MSQNRYTRRLDADVRSRVAYDLDRGRVTEFVVQVEIKIGGKWRPVVRFDTAHGFPHRDRYRADGTVSRHEPLEGADFNQALTLALREIDAYWERWCNSFRNRWKHDKE